MQTMTKAFDFQGARQQYKKNEARKSISLLCDGTTIKKWNEKKKKKNDAEKFRNVEGGKKKP